MNKNILLLYQDNPIYGKFSTYRPQGWTETVTGYLREANILSRCLWRNRLLVGEKYAWHAVINHDEVLSPDIISDIWTKATRKLKRHGIICIWVREVSRDNKIHYHLLGRAPTARAEVRKAIEESMPPRDQHPWRKRVERIRQQYELCNYITKAKVTGRTPEGKYLKDLHRGRRLLFAPHLNLRKHGTIGNFWIMSKRKLWKEIQVQEQTITEGLETPGIDHLIAHVYQLTGGYFPHKKVRRSCGYFVTEPVMQNWLREALQERGIPEVPEWTGSIGTFPIPDLSGDMSDLLPSGSNLGEDIAGCRQ